MEKIACQMKIVSIKESQQLFDSLTKATLAHNHSHSLTHTHTHIFYTHAECGEIVVVWLLLKLCMHDNTEYKFNGIGIGGDNSL